MIYLDGTGSHLQNSSPGQLQTVYDQSVSHALSDCGLFCPKCRSRNTLIPSGSYSRYCFNCSADVANQTLLQVRTMKCTCCGCETSIVPEWFCPYSHFTYSFILEILHTYFHSFNQNKSRTAAAFGISRKVLCSLVKKFRRDLFSSLLTSAFCAWISSPEQALVHLHQSKGKLYAFLRSFFHCASIPWLTRHFKNPSFRMKPHYIFCSAPLE